MEQPQELEVWYVLPKIRKTLATELKLLGLSQKDIAKKLEITPAAVSYYIKSKRANKMEIEIDDEIKKKPEYLRQKNHRRDFNSALRNTKKP